MYLLSTGHKIFISINKPRLVYHIYMCECVSLRALTEPYPTKLSHVTYILLLCDLWLQQALGLSGCLSLASPVHSQPISAAFHEYFSPKVNKLAIRALLFAFCFLIKKKKVHNERNKNSKCSDCGASSRLIICFIAGYFSGRAGASSCMCVVESCWSILFFFF